MMITPTEGATPDTLSRRDRRLANARRLYNEELPEAALNPFADWQEDAQASKLQDATRS
jgi:hypothetical protein